MVRYGLIAVVELFLVTVMVAFGSLAVFMVVGSVFVMLVLGSLPLFYEAFLL